ncbi:MAG: Asp-tRNA(Asn)/Glu-tRNA(Gln) amidotransferase subunit GatC [Legionellales bacterium]|nr:Asp-tRNA(Asn)/Glu-tRNA(Gln) amidotransferase subunit GatC [Legionellales bacterium]
MTCTEQELSDIASLASLEIESQSMPSYAKDLVDMRSLACLLQNINTTDVAPLFHPLHLFQRLRPDDAHAEPCVIQLAQMAPSFTDDLYWVPKVIDSGN